MGRSKETFGKKDVRTKQLKKRKEKEKRRLEKKDESRKTSLDDMLAWVDENGQLVSSPPDKSEKQEIKAETIEVSVPKGGSTNTNRTYTGRIKNFDESKGYGFINCGQLKDSVFFHVNDCKDQVNSNDKVEFETETGLKGLKAQNVRVIK